MAQIKTHTTEWLKAAAIRALKTAAQTALGMITVGAAVSDIQWGQVASVAAVAAIYSLLTSVAGLPEVDGTTYTGSIEQSLYADGEPVTPFTYSDDAHTWHAEMEEEETEGTAPETEE